MPIFSKVYIFLVVAGLFFQNSIWANSYSPSVQVPAAFHYTHKKLEALPEARLFEAHVAGVQIVGAEMGPEKGTPVLLVGGFTSTYPYMRKLMRALVDLGHRVYVYNPPGQGRGDLESGHDTDRSQLGIDGMLKVFPAVRDFAYQNSGGQQVIVLGHSLGGLQVRLGSLGVVFDELGHAFISPEQRALARKQTKLIVSMNSMGLNASEVWHSEGQMKALLMKDVTPVIAECINAACEVPWPFNVMALAFSTSYLKSTQSSLHKGVFGAPDFDQHEFDEIARYLLPQKVSRQIRRDITRWLSDKVFSTNSGFDLGKEWFVTQANPAVRIPTIYITSEHDSVVENEPTRHEAAMIPGSRVFHFDSGHIGVFLSQTEPAQLAKIVSNYPCQTLLLPRSE